MPQPLIFLKDQRVDSLHSEVMALIGEVSHYQGEWGQEGQSGQSTYYNVQIRQLFTRLYQTAALFMLQRAEREGDMKREDVARESARIISEQFLPEVDHLALDGMDADLRRFNQESIELARQAQHLVGLFLRGEENIPHQQLKKIEAVFSIAAR